MQIELLPDLLKLMKSSRTDVYRGSTCNKITVKLQNFLTLKMLLKSLLRFKQRCLSIEKLCPNRADGMVDRVHPDQEQSGLGLHCLSRPICPKTWDHYGKIIRYHEIQPFNSFIKLLSNIVGIGSVRLSDKSI